MSKSLVLLSAVGSLLIAGCSSIKTVVLPGAATLKEAESAFIWKEYKGLFLSVDGHPDTDTETFTQYTVAPGKHTVDVTVVRLIRDTGMVYSGKPLKWTGTIDAKAGHKYLIMARDNGTKSIQLFMQVQDPPDFEKFADVDLADLAVQ